MEKTKVFIVDARKDEEELAEKKLNKKFTEWQAHNKKAKIVARTSSTIDNEWDMTITVIVFYK